MSQIHAEDCYGKEFESTAKECVICCENVLCSILFKERLEKIVADREREKGGYLDSNKFDCIDRSEVKQWLAIKPRAFDQFVAKIQKFSECADKETTVWYCKSFIKETKGVCLKQGIVIVK